MEEPSRSCSTSLGECPTIALARGIFTGWSLGGFHGLILTDQVMLLRLGHTFKLRAQTQIRNVGQLLSVPSSLLIIPIFFCMLYSNIVIDQCTYVRY